MDRVGCPRDSLRLAAAAVAVVRRKEGRKEGRTDGRSFHAKTDRFSAIVPDGDRSVALSLDHPLILRSSTPTTEQLDLLLTHISKSYDNTAALHLNS